MTIQHLVAIAATSGGILYLMVFLLLVALTVIIERTWYLRSTIRRGNQVSQAVAQLRQLDLDALDGLMVRAGRHPLSALLAVPLHHPEITDPDQMAAMLEEAILWQAPQIDARLWVLDTVVTLAPLLGLLGTIIGMFTTFQVLANAANSPSAVTGGVAEALVATAAGLGIAIMGLVAFNGLNNDVRLIVHQMETLKVMLINRLGVVRVAVWDHGGEAKMLRPAPVAGE